MHAAVLEFCEKGYDRAKMEEIARRAGIGKSTIYEYFPSKLDLLTATGDSILDEILLDIQKLLDADRPVRQALTDYLEYITGVMGSFGANFMNIVGDHEVTGTIHRLCIRYVKVVLADLERILAAAQETGEISRDVNIHTAASLIVSIPSPPFIRMISHRPPYASIERLLDLLFDGLAPR